MSNGTRVMIRKKMTDTERVMILLTAIRCILALQDIPKGGLRLKLIKSVLFEAVQQCGRKSILEDLSPIFPLIRTIEDEAAMREIIL
jgi:hypothetical protein